jgi:hypothetical protein
VSDARWIEIEDATASAVKHFSGAVSIFSNLATAEDRYLVEMAFLHAMLAGHTSLESALVRILELLGERAPTGPRSHADLIARVTRHLDNRPAILTGQAAMAAAETRRFHSIAVHAYDNFDEAQAVKAVEAAKQLASTLTTEIAQFRRAIDP